MKALICLLFACLALVGCSKTRVGKVHLEDGPPAFLQVGSTSLPETLKQLGEPLGYREFQGRMGLLYIDFTEIYFNYLFGTFRHEQARTLRLVFEDNVLQKLEVSQEGWGFEGEVDTGLLQGLAR